MDLIFSLGVIKNYIDYIPLKGNLAYYSFLGYVFLIIIIIIMFKLRNNINCSIFINVPKYLIQFLVIRIVLFIFGILNLNYLKYTNFMSAFFILIIIHILFFLKKFLGIESISKYTNDKLFILKYLNDKLSILKYLVDMFFAFIIFAFAMFLGIIVCLQAYFKNDVLIVKNNENGVISISNNVYFYNKEPVVITLKNNNDIVLISTLSDCKYVSDFRVEKNINFQNDVTVLNLQSLRSKRKCFKYFFDLNNINLNDGLYNISIFTNSSYDKVVINESFSKENKKYTFGEDVISAEYSSNRSD